MSTSDKTLLQLVNVLTTTLEELHAHVIKQNGKIEMGTTQWSDFWVP